MSHKGQERFAKGKHNMSHTGSFVQRAGEVCKCVLLSNSDLERGISQTVNCYVVFCFQVEGPGSPEESKEPRVSSDSDRCGKSLLPDSTMAREEGGEEDKEREKG